MPVITDALAPRFPVSVKGVVLLGDRVILLRNDRDEWELPGGKLEPSESPEECCAREMLEELALAVSVDELLDCWVYDILGQVEVVIVTYGCTSISTAAVRISSEHKEVGYFTLDELEALAMPLGYRTSIERWWNRRRAGNT